MDEALKTRPLGASVEALQYHYDISNDFYKLWLDSRFLSYTCALWEKKNETLESAQLRKADYHCRQVRIKDAKRVLDLGCGWGGLLKYLVKTYDMTRAVGLTLNQSHVDFITAFNNPRIEVCLENWSAYAPEELYDIIFAWGVMEHAAKPELSAVEKVQAYRHFFKRCHELLKPGGRISLQTIACGNMRRADLNQFIATQIFPESDLPTLAEIAQASERLFVMMALRNDRQDYVRTCRAWLSRLKANHAAAVDLVGEEVVASYEKYLNLSLIGFHIGTTHLLRITLHRLDKPSQ